MENIMFMTAKEAASFLGVKMSYLYKLVYERRIPCFKPLGKLLFDKVELENFVRAGRISTQAELDDKAEALLNSRGR